MESVNIITPNGKESKKFKKNLITEMKNDTKSVVTI